MNKWFWLAVVMLLPLGCEPEWRMRTSDDGTYSVYLPSSTRKETRGQGSSAQTTLVAEHRNGAYMVSYTDLPPGVAPNFDNFVNTIVRSQGGSLLKSTAVRVGGAAQGV